VSLIGALEMYADNGSLVMNSPGFGFETELSGESAIERVQSHFLRGIEGADREH